MMTAYIKLPNNRMQADGLRSPLMRSVRVEQKFHFKIGKTLKIFIPFRFEAAAYSASLPVRVKSFIFIARPLVAHPVKG
jgi:hypothetical protein